MENDNAGEVQFEKGDEKNVVEAMFLFNEELFDKADIGAKEQTAYIVKQLLELLTNKIQLAKHLPKA